jgi:hypothetical protein
MTSPRLVLGYGLGVDSTAIVLRWDEDPSTMPVPWEEVLVVTAMTGDEYPRTGALVERHILPLFRKHAVRYAQVARGGQPAAAGTVVLDDSRSPERVRLFDGPWSLSAEMRAAGTVPQVGGERRCSIHAKGDVLDPFIRQEVPGPYLHVLGFEAGEARRAKKDAKYNTDRRTGVYPLIGWGWGRDDCAAYIRARTGEDWPKSACYFCPFALTSAEGPHRALDLYAGRPQAAVDALLMEHVARSLNPLQGLAGPRRFLADMLSGDPRQQLALSAFARSLDEAAWRLYEVRRAWVPAKSNPAKTRSLRSLRTLDSGTRAAMNGALHREAAARSAGIDDPDGISRAWVLRRGAAGSVPDAEHLLVAAPAGAADKQQDGFEAAFAFATANQAAALF